MRRTLIQHPPESEVTLDLMSEAADLLVAGNKEAAAEKVMAADIDALRNWFHFDAQVTTKSFERHGIVSPGGPPKGLKTRGSPKQSDFWRILERDGWHCRFCEIRIIDPRARDRIRKLLPGVLRWDGTNLTKHACLAVMASPDHVLPKSWGGSNEMENLVTACWACQFSRVEYRIDDCGISDPRERPAIKDEWDGLLRVRSIRV